MSDTRRFVLTALYAAWVIVFGYAFVAYSQAPYEGAGFPDGLNKPAVYLGWQGVAGMIAVAVFGLGLAWPRGSGVRRIASVPLILALLHLALIGAVMVWARS